ncbi:hypothetical protein QE381_002038 [Microbacterium sp. SORGH_AS 888]|nr:hypothetical protein [Microbacterium sp. SORGH_AS_0888]
MNARDRLRQDAVLQLLAKRNDRYESYPPARSM